MHTEFLQGNGIEALPQFLTSLAIGLLIGLERERNPSAKAGLRTFALVALFGTMAALLAEKLDSPWLLIAGLLAVADPNEVWIFEICPVGPLWTPESGKPGAVWAAQRVPDDHVSVCPNESRIGEIDLANKIQLERLMVDIGSVADKAEDAAHTLEIIAIKRTV